ncbi:MAG: DUF1385 domain-containing protein [Actinomycetota bacterium]|nr:DUF1385 domain-containing protein [Actinomycetota bacterium]
MVEEKIRLGGMALANGVLVHGPAAWACAVRTPQGRIDTASGYKRFPAALVQQPLLRGPARLLEVVTLLPRVRRALPAARLPFERPVVIVTMVVSALAAQAVKRSSLRPFARELVGSLLSLAPTALAVRGSEVAGYHGAEHISIGSYEHGERREKEHERCGSHMVGPLLLSSAVGGAMAAHAPKKLQPAAKATAQLGALAASTEIFAWMVRNPEHKLSRALARPGHELQHRLATEEPTPEQLEVAEAALRACLELEQQREGSRAN